MIGAGVAAGVTGVAGRGLSAGVFSWFVTAGSDSIYGSNTSPNLFS